MKARFLPFLAAAIASAGVGAARAPDYPAAVIAFLNR